MSPTQIRLIAETPHNDNFAAGDSATTDQPWSMSPPVVCAGSGCSGPAR